MRKRKKRTGVKMTKKSFKKLMNQTKIMSSQILIVMMMRSMTTPTSNKTNTITRWKRMNLAWSSKMKRIMTLINKSKKSTIIY